MAVLGGLEVLLLKGGIFLVKKGALKAIASKLAVYWVGHGTAATIAAGTTIMIGTGVVAVTAGIYGRKIPLDFVV